MTVAFVPMKLNNERLPGKNTLPFADGRPLFHSILRQLACVTQIQKIYVYCSDPSIRELLPPGVELVLRSDSLDASTTKINEVIQAFAKDVEADTYVMAHATAPFLSAGSISRMAQSVAIGAHDSAISVLAIREFLWRQSQPLNYDPTNIPRTQDLEEIWAETSGAWVFGKALALQGRRVGENPALIEVSKIEAMDINEAGDFVIAQAVLASQNVTG